MIPSILEAANELVARFQSEPYHFLYESDLQCTLFGLLRGRLQESFSVARSGVRGSAGEPYRLHPVCAEYQTPRGRLDLACIDASAVDRVPREPSLGFDMYVYRLPVLVGIELKLRKMGDRGSLFADCESDRKKLASLRSDAGTGGIIRHGLVLGFHQDVSMDVSGFAVERSTKLAKKELLPLTASQAIEIPDAVYVITPEERFLVSPTS